MRHQFTGSSLRAALGRAIILPFLAWSALVAAAPAAEIYIPPELEPWVGWVLAEHPEVGCPLAVAERADCVWVSGLDIEVTAGGLGFSMTARLYAPARLELPGDAGLWPLQVTVNGSRLAVVRSGSRPALQLDTGSYRVQGLIPWTRRPDSVPLPGRFGLLRLRIDDQDIARPTVTQGRLLLGQRSAGEVATQRDQLKVDVYRRLIDDLPLRLETFLRLQVAGASRIETLGRVLLPEFAHTALDSPLPARLTPDGDLQVQVQPGEYLISVAARALGQPAEFGPDRRGQAWPEQEVWAFQPRRELRLVTLSGGAGVDLGQINAPFEVTGLQGYLLGGQDRLQLLEQQRGDPNPAPGDIRVRRDLWLNFDGSGFVVRDRLQADLRRATRLAANYTLGSIALNGVNQLVTRLEDGEPGVELNAGSHNIEAVSAVAGEALGGAVGWAFDAGEVQATLNLPPGWRLLWARGVDGAPTSWLARWDLWDLFIVILTLVLCWRFYGRGFTLLIGLTLVLAYQQSPELAIAWLVLASLLVTLGLLRRNLATQGRLQTLVRTLAGAVAFFTVLGALSVAIDHARQSLYPQLGGGVLGYADATAGYSLEAPSAEFTELSEVVAPASPAPRMAVRKQAGSLTRSLDDTAVAAAEPARYPEGMQVQTGPGVPAWTWERAPLVWHGPVSAEQPLALTLLPPTLVRLWHGLVALAVLLVTGLLLLPLLGRPLTLPGWLRRMAPQMLSLFAVVGLALQGAPAVSATVDPVILKQLEQRLLQPPACAPGCASIGSVQLDLSGDELELRLDIHAAALVAVPLPGSVSGWLPAAVEVDGEPAVVSGATDEPLQIALTPGVHQVRLRGSLAALEQIELEFALPPGLVRVNNRSDWQVQGLRDQRLVRGSLTLLRERARTEAVAGEAREPMLQADPAPAYVRVERFLDFGLDWRVRTRVSRLSPERGGFSVAIPLLPGEAVLDQGISVREDRAQLVFGPGQSAITWQSTLAPAAALRLNAPDLGDHQEIWAFSGSNLWHLHYRPSAGLVASTIAGRAGPVFYPRSGESLEVRPEATVPIPGEVVTVHGLQLAETPGERLRTSELTLDIQASQGGSYAVGLPAQTELTGVFIDAVQQPIGLRDGQVDLPLTTGRSSYRLTWRAPLSDALMIRTQPVALPGPVSNISLTSTFPRDRWVLALGGPELGPAVLFWGVLIVVALAGLVLVRVPGMPFRRSDALLLALGLTLCNIAAAVWLVIWVLVLRARAQWIEQINAVMLRNSVQVLTAALTVITVIVLVASVPMALLGTPDMQINGNGSSAYLYRWYADSADGALPAAWVFSLPLWVYRVAMLIWSLWLALALMRWLRWGWERWSQPQGWYARSEVAGGAQADSGGTP